MPRFINPVKMAEDLARGSITRVEKMRFLLIYLVLIFGISQFSVYQVSSSSGRPIIEIVVDALFIVAGLLFCWKIGSGEEREDFVTNVICLSVPAVILVNLVTICIGIILYQAADSIYQMASINPEVAYHTIIYAQLIIFHVLYWGLIAAGLYRISKISSADLR